MENLFIKYFTQSLSEEEKIILFDRLENDPDLKEEFFKSQKAWALAGTIDDKQHINNKFKRTSSFTIFKRVYAAASILLLVGLVALIFLSIPSKKILFKNELVTITTGNGKQLKQILPDGSIVWLNGGTKISFPKKFGKTREVKLEGEAYFEVTKDKTHPFCINAGFAKVKVLGTGFNVVAFAADKHMVTTLVHGKIILETSSNNKNEVTKMEMSPGQQIVTFSDKDEILRKWVNTSLYTSWMDGVYRFQEEYFWQIALRVERDFNIRMHTNDEALKNKRYTGAFRKTDDALKILRFINLSTPIRYSMKGNDIYISLRNINH
ncbi:MAG: FecR family protein [Bacteroidetes bacterium]|nr:FecR family protein [Bacteroidota bacterium]